LDQHEDPQWVRVLAFVIAAAVAAYGAVGLLLAVIGWYSLPLVLVVGTPMFAGLCVLARPLLAQEGVVSRASQVGAAVAVVAIVAITMWNVSNASQQVLVIRDGGTYLNAGKWISAHGTLEVKPYSGPFTPTSGLRASSAGMGRRGDHLDFTLEHMLPALLAEAQGVGGDRLMFAAVPLLGGAALLAFYLFARRVLRHPLAALAAMLSLGLLMPQVSFSRDSTTEIPMQVLLFSAAWLLCDRRALSKRGTAFVTGLFLGLLQAMHVDGLVFALGLPIIGLTCWLRAEPVSERRRIAWAMLFAALGVAIGVALGFYDLLHRSHLYYHTIRSDIVRLSAASLLLTAGAIAFAFLWHKWSTRSDALLLRIRRAQPATGSLAFAGVALAGFGAWIVRPSLQTVHAAPNIVVKIVQQRTHLPVDATRRYFEHSMQWASWYIGPVALAIAIAGAAYAVRAWVRGELRVPSQVAALVLAPPALLYLWRPSITPDQIWSMRRFLPAVFPILLLAAFGALCVLSGRDRFGAADARRVIAVVLGVLVLAYPVYAISNVSRMNDQRGFHAAVLDACRIIGDDGAIVVPQEAAPLTWLYDPQTLRSFCDVPVGIMLSGQKSALSTRLPGGKLDPKVLRSLARQWAAEKRTLYIVAGNAKTIRKLFPLTSVSTVPKHVNKHLLEQTLTSRPGEFNAEQVAFAIARVPT
jgi:hypothetical protein